MDIVYPEPILSKVANGYRPSYRDIYYDTDSFVIHA